MSAKHFLLGDGELGVAAALVVAGAACGATLVHFLMEPMRWRRAYLPASGSSELAMRVRDVLLCTALATYLLPFKLGIPLRIGMLRHRAGLELSFIGAVLALDALVSLGVWAISTLLFVWVAALHWQSSWLLWVGGGCGGVALIAIIVMRKRISVNLLQRWHSVVGLLNNLWRCAGVSATLVIADIGSYWLRHALLVLLATGNPRLMVVGGASGVVATFAGMVSGMPMGLLGYDATLLALLGAAGIRIEQALAVVVVNRGLNFIAAGIVGIPAGIRLGLGTGVMSTLRKLREVGNGKQ